MITADEVKKAARNKGFPAGVVEKDYALTWLLYGVYNSELKDVLAFKGGTALSKVYFPNFWRSFAQLFSAARAGITLMSGCS